MLLIELALLGLTTSTLYAMDAEKQEDQNKPAPASEGIGLAGEINKPLESVGLSFYGHFKLDMSRDTAETNFGNTAYFVKNYAPGQADDEINITARHSRLGLDWDGPEFGGINAFGKIEIDFIGKSLQPNTETRELQGAVRMRHAYMDFDFGDGWSLLAGQTWDVFAPLNMKKLNTLVGWGQGNIAFRRPQLRGAKKIGLGETSALTTKLALARPVAVDQTWDAGAQDDGEDSGYPDLQAHVGLKTPCFGSKPLQVGVGGFVGWREVDAPFNEEYASWGAAVDVSIPILDNLSLLGEAWTGRGLDGYRAGVWQSYSPDGVDIRVIRAKGVWANVVWKPFKAWRLVGGAGVDDPLDHDLTQNSQKKRNNTFFGNVMYTFYKGATVGVEYDRMQTDYVSRSRRVNHRTQVSFMLKF
jgi:hypothetical protein